MIDLTNPEYQKLFIDLMLIQYDFNKEMNTLTVGGVVYDANNPDISFLMSKAVDASQEIVDICRENYVKVFESNQGPVN